nr:MAG TPA: hypothetical protein [Caudoviricetes sp.]
MQLDADQYGLLFLGGYSYCGGLSFLYKGGYFSTLGIFLLGGCFHLFNTLVYLTYLIFC